MARSYYPLCAPVCHSLFHAGASPEVNGEAARQQDMLITSDHSGLGFWQDLALLVRGQNLENRLCLRERGL